MIIAIIGASNAEETRLLEKEAQKRNWEVLSIGLRDLIFIAEIPPKVIYNDKNFVNCIDAVIFRGMTKNPNENLILANLLNQRGIRVIDNRLATSRYLTTKMATSFNLAQKNINHPKTLFTTNPKNLNRILNNLEFPIIVKDIVGKHSKGVYRFQEESEITEFFKTKKIKDFIFQEDLKTNEYYRVFTIGYKTIGVIKRVKISSLNSSGNVSGVRSKQIKPKAELIEIAEKAAKIVNNEICGLDIIEKNGKFYIIEANRAPQFRAFSEKTGINVAEKILNYVQETTKSKKIA